LQVKGEIIIEPKYLSNGARTNNIYHIEPIMGKIEKMLADSKKQKNEEEISTLIRRRAEAFP